MIVDDKSANLSVMAAILRPHFRVLEANDGQEALTMLQTMDDAQEVACIVSDHRMPRMTGVELFEQLQPLLPNAVRIIVTGYIDVDAVVDAINKAEVYKFIVKPFDAREFLAMVQRAVDKFDEEQNRHAGLLAENRALQARIAALEAR
ncbi:response regulator [Pseudoduganella sp. OTU4001]|uniref:response regulator n=1 Tax=Pseudoduganella sp. OTU4001 TaxID=3043854 RepID=UPI00313D286F